MADSHDSDRASLPLPSEDSELLAFIEQDFHDWLSVIFPNYVFARFGKHHDAFWRHIWQIERGVRPQPFIAAWSRGHGKSSTAELGCVALGARNKRSYALYVSGTADQACRHLESINNMLESEAFEDFYPIHAERKLGKYAQVKSWRRNRLRTAGGFTIDAVGLDEHIRGIRTDDQRPDLIVFDDLDNSDDTLDKTEKRISRLLRDVLPARSQDAAIFGIQNIIHRHGIFARLAGISEKPADFLADRILSGPVKAVDNAEIESIDGKWVLTGGTSTWEGMDLEACQDNLTEVGILAFQAEYQHDVDVPAGGLYDHIVFEVISQEQFEQVWVDRTALWMDPAVTAEGDCHAIQIDALGRDGKLYRLFSWEQRATPQAALELALQKAIEYEVSHIGIEDVQGKETWRSVLKEARMNYAEKLDPSDPEEAEMLERLEHINLKTAKTSESQISKIHRSSRMLSAYERKQIVHVAGTSYILEAALKRFPKTKPLDLADAAAYSWHDLRGKVPAKSMSVAGRKMGRRLTAVR